ncbi:MAG: class C sortase [Enterococcus sp.]|uniref:sortase family protein n=1 Tax=Enterococcus sp. TaxID=35783 RepID=UPI00264A314E|nr:class C sortase [Enterococcus sp.]MDN6003124.1 class C sortase [Enterococcus sp.]MDN6561350.1 class C sortase [Enterococcus sp.]MDN6777742.1 class C sortase [Enterococcus sp.]
METGMKKKKNRSFLMVFAIIMIVAGVALLLYPIVGNYLANRERSEATAKYDQELKQMSQEEIRNQWQLAKKYNNYIFKKQQGEAAEPMAYKNIANVGDTMGTIDIPAIDIEKMPFYHGTSYQTLDKGLGHIESTSIPVGGKNTNAVITGHSGVKNQVLFTDVRNLEEGDVFYINILGKRLAYEIESFEEILPSEVDRIKVRPGRDLVTLLTCTPPGINTYRLLVTGHRVPYKQAVDKKVNKRNLFSYQNVVLATLAFNVLLFLILVLIYRYQIKRFRSHDPKKYIRAAKQLRRLFMATKIYFFLLLLVMITTIAFAIFGYTQMQEDTQIDDVQIGNQLELSDYNLEKINQAEYGEKQIASVNVADYAKAKNMLQDTTNKWGIGKLVIPSVDINLPILAGLSNQNLLSGASTLTANQQLGRGNYVLLAHNIFDQDLLLHRIQNLKKKDNIYATDFESVFQYEVSVNKVIEDTEVSYIENTVGLQKPIITLLRCEGNIGTKYRRVVQGTLIKKIPLKDADDTQLQAVGLEKKGTIKNGELLKEDPVPTVSKTSMNVAAKIISDPMQTVVPLFLMLLLPILFFSLVR